MKIIHGDKILPPSLKTKNNNKHLHLLFGRGGVNEFSIYSDF